MSQRPRKHGEFCWFNLITRKPADERQFFTAVLGWDYFSMGPMGEGVQVSGEKVGGFFDIEHPDTPPGTPVQLGVMIRVDDVDATLARAAALGATVQPAMQIGNNGRMGMCTDPTGARFDLWQPMGQPSMTPTAGLHGAPSWWELLTNNTDKAAQFYSKLFGWECRDSDTGGMVYTTFHLGDWAVAGMMPVLKKMGDVKPEWRVYYTVPDVDQAARQVKKLGGKVCFEPQDLPKIGRFACLMSPQGVVFHAIKYIEPQSEG